jgi:hypothetical protein
LKIINNLLVAVIIGVTAFFSIFWIGSYERKIQLIAELPLSFVQRVSEVSVLGSTGVLVLLLFNFIHDRFYKKNVNVAFLKRIAFVGLSRVAIAICGSVLFFYS